MACSRLSSSVVAAHGVRWKQSSSPLSNGSTGSTIAVSSSRSAMCRQPRPRNATMPDSRTLHWRRNSNQIASGRPGAVHYVEIGEGTHMVMWEKNRDQLFHVVEDFLAQPNPAEP